MAAHLETWSKEEIRAVIRFLNAKSLNPTEIHKELQSVYGEHVISRTQVYHWCNLFEAGNSDLTDREGRGRSITATSEDNVKRVDELIRQDRRLKLHEIAVLKFRKLLPIELYLMNLATEKSAQDMFLSN